MSNSKKELRKLKHDRLKVFFDELRRELREKAESERADEKSFVRQTRQNIARLQNLTKSTYFYQYTTNLQRTKDDVAMFLVKLMGIDRIGRTPSPPKKLQV